MKQLKKNPVESSQSGDLQDASRALIVTYSPEKELEMQKSWCKTILEFLIRKLGKSQGLEVFLDVVEEQRFPSHFKSIRHDLIQWIMVLSIIDFRDLNRQLIKRFGTGLHTSLKQGKYNLKSIMDRGVIANDEEYRFVLSYLDERVHGTVRMGDPLHNSDQGAEDGLTLKAESDGAGSNSGVRQMGLSRAAEGQHRHPELSDVLAVLNTYQ